MCGVHCGTLHCTDVDSDCALWTEEVLKCDSYCGGVASTASGRAGTDDAVEEDDASSGCQCGGQTGVKAGGRKLSKGLP